MSGRDWKGVGMRIRLVVGCSFLFLSWPAQAMQDLEKLGGTVISVVVPQEENFGDFGGDDGQTVIDMNAVHG